MALSINVLVFYNLTLLHCGENHLLVLCVQVREVKGVIEQQNAEFPAAQLKLIHSGQILKDDSTLAEYKIKEEEFLVCMVTKVRSENLHASVARFSECVYPLPQSAPPINAACSAAV